jgi:four helix bundle protein
MDQPTLLKARTKRFALDILQLLQTLARDEPGWTVRKQLTKSATGMAANYRAACRARSHREFTAKIGTVEEESDESLFWLEIIDEAGLSKSPMVQKLLREADELCAIFSATHSTARQRDEEERGRIW